MNEVYRQVSGEGEAYLGYVDEDGKVHEHKSESDKRVGKVDLESGKIYEARIGPDKNIGYVDLQNGKIYYAASGEEEPVGRVDDQGNLYDYKALAPGERLGRVKDMLSLAHGAGGFLLLLIPAIDEQAAKNNIKVAFDDPATNTGNAGAPA
jgi:hypothetical protein